MVLKQLIIHLQKRKKTWENILGLGLCQDSLSKTKKLQNLSLLELKKHW